VVLGVALALMALGLSQCRMIGDQLTGVSVSPAAAANCVSQCAKVWNDSMRVERGVHLDNVHACKGDEACLATEDARWAQVVDRIAAGRHDCQQNCQHQGSGGGGR
jgi:hypothetical protein